MSGGRSIAVGEQGAGAVEQVGRSGSAVAYTSCGAPGSSTLMRMTPCCKSPT
jgi:hypothetical protein